MEIDVIVTFDEMGISHHPNHIAAHNGVAHLFESERYKFDVLTLTTVSKFRKYIGFGDISNCMPDQLHYFNFNPFSTYKNLKIHWS